MLPEPYKKNTGITDIPAVKNAGQIMTGILYNGGAG